jgi:hypothetical protein
MTTYGSLYKNTTQDELEALRKLYASPEVRETPGQERPDPDGFTKQSGSGQMGGVPRGTPQEPGLAAR